MLAVSLAAKLQPVHVLYSPTIKLLAIATLISTVHMYIVEFFYGD